MFCFLGEKSVDIRKNVCYYIIRCRKNIGKMEREGIEKST